MITVISQREHKTGKRYSENTVEDYKIAVKRFYRWLLANDGEVPEVVKWIKKKRATNKSVKPDNMITEAEMAKIVEACKNARDRALFSLLYDSGCRIGGDFVAEAEGYRVRRLWPCAICNRKDRIQEGQGYRELSCIHERMAECPSS